MKASELLTRRGDSEEKLVYQLIRSEAICLRQEGYDTSYSVLVARVEGDAVTESAFAYDVSRTEEGGCRVLNELWLNGAEPDGINDTVSELI